MQLVLHAPFGSRINKAWGLALRKRFCRQFNFELQAAATEDALLLSLGPQHSFPLADVFRYLHPGDGARRAGPGVSRRAGLPDALALEHDDLAGRAAQPRRPQGAAAAAADAGRRPDGGGLSRRGGLPREHPRRSRRFPIIRSSTRPSATASQEAMDFDGLRRRARPHPPRRAPAASRATRRSRRLFAHEILNARPYAFLDDAPLEERRTQAVQARRAGETRRRPAISARSTRRRSSACATRRGPTRATPTSCTTRC